jgi:hypothetical protein
MQEFLRKSKGSSSKKEVPEYEAAKALKQGARSKLATILSSCKDDECRLKAKENFKEQTLDDSASDTDFNKEVEKAARKQALEMSEGCDKKEENCADVLVETYRRSKGLSTVSVPAAIAAIKEAAIEDRAANMKSCLQDGKSYIICKKLIIIKKRNSKSWDNRTTTANSNSGSGIDDSNDAPPTISENAEAERELRKGAAAMARNTWVECKQIAKKIEENSAKILKFKECHQAFRDELRLMYPKRLKDTQDLDTQKKNKLKDRKDLLKAADEAKIGSLKETIDAEMTTSQESDTKKTHAEMMEIIKKAIDETPPVDDDEDPLINPAASDAVEDKTKYEKYRRRVGIQKIREAARACKELGPTKCQAKRNVPKTVSSSTTSTTNDDEEQKTINLIDEASKVNGDKLINEDINPGKAIKELREAAREEVQNAISDCADLNANSNNMKECIKDAEEVANLIEGKQDNTNEEERKRRYEKARWDDAFKAHDACMSKTNAKYVDCKNVIKDRMDKTKIDNEDTTTNNEKIMQEKMTLAERLAKDSKYKNDIVKRETDTVKKKEQENKASNKLKNDAINYGITIREVGIVQQRASEIAIIEETGDFIRSKKEDGNGEATDSEIEKYIEDKMKLDPNSPDPTTKKKKEMIRNAKASASDGLSSALKLKENKKTDFNVKCTDCEVTAEKIIKFIEFNDDVKNVVNTNTDDKLDGPTIIKQGKNEITGDTM